MICKIYPRHEKKFQYLQINQRDTPITKWRIKTTWFSKYIQKKLLTKFSVQLWALHKVVIRKKNLNTKAFYDKLIANFVFNGEKMKAFPKIRNMTRMPTHTTFI